ncbi:MAG: protein-glutamate O-methyltransferase CheR [Alicyclobacillus macrosporangiidus]|uniref:CheR family methyltransferase n=1 Tax=Alicyclobacillus macrosporangiidus TaxID=392015 RepID=UPI0026ED4430|nr:protein-glutamate O-methyltransferase CheR [Alicyclobacillus macrosporangiidus]MCL6600189.1 protein-glutamate O-methyltransferase CheR [Alicyclobacillus macrosporangiidus]
MKNMVLRQLAELVNRFYGLNYIDNISALESKLAKRVKELGLSFWEYHGYLLQQPDEWDVVIELLTINETYFYREESQLLEFQNTVLPMIKENLNGRPIRIWSAACSSGEEPYTLAMLILETGLFLPDEVQIVGTDIDKQILEKAKTGWYGKQSLSFRRIPQFLLERYFVENDGGFMVNDVVKSMVEFQHLNLIDEEGTKKLGLFDVVFCRNVLIYFDTKTIQKVISSIYRRLYMGGYLFLGHAETITGMGLGFETVHSPATFYYQKEASPGVEVRGFSG